LTCHIIFLDKDWENLCQFKKLGQIVDEWPFMQCMLSMDSTNVGIHQIFMMISVPCVVDPSVNTLRVPNPNFPPKPNFCNLFWFPANKIHSEINILHTLAKIVKHNFLNLTHWGLQQHQECPRISLQFPVLILFNFHRENGSIINSFHIVGPIQMGAPLIIKRYQECDMKPCFGRPQSTKQNKLPSLINNFWVRMKWQLH
jgi:hypothetical protein